jgi:glycosyltransferase involved in cell wall biosynthesis
MRVLQVSSGNLFGGIETVLCSLAEHDALAPGTGGHFALCFHGRLSHQLEALGAEVYSLGEVRIRNPFSVGRARRMLENLLREKQFDAAICHSAWSQALFGGTIRDAGLASIFWLHGAVNGDHWLERLASRSRPDFVIANSQYTNGTLDRLYPGVPSEVLYHPLAVATPSLNDEERAEIRRGCNTTPDAVVVVHNSRMEPWKGHGQLLDALARLADDPRWVCWIAGSAQRPHEATYVRDLRAMAESAGIAPRVRFIGQRTDVPQVLAAADIHCQPNVEAEPFGVVFIEALSAGRPVVTTDMGGPREIIDDGCGILVPPGDTGRLAESLHRLIDEPELRASLGGRGPARARELCDPKRQLSRLDDICARARGEMRKRTTRKEERWRRTCP